MGTGSARVRQQNVAVAAGSARCGAHWPGAQCRTAGARQPGDGEGARRERGSTT